MMPVQAKNLIRGVWRDSGSGETVESANPAVIREVIGVAPRSTAQDVTEAVEAAREVFGSWRRLSRINRGEMIDNFTQLIKREVDDLARTVTLECGKPLNEARAEVIEVLHMGQYVAGLSRMPHGEMIASEIAGKDAYVFRKPKGVVALVTPWNFPTAVPSWMFLPSLLEGNTIVWKPSEETPVCAHKMTELIMEAGFPAGVFNVVHGVGEEAGEALVTHPDVDVVLFTGSAAVGKRIQQVCAAHPHKFAATEMGGKNAVIVLDRANIEIALHAAALSAFKTAGQRCVSSGRIIVDRKIEPEFTRRFVEVARGIRVGSGMDPSTFICPMINQSGVEKYERHNAKAREEGADILVDGCRLSEGEYSEGHYASPFVYRMEHRPNSYVLREEAFSPHVAIIPVDGMEHAVEVYNDTEYGLSMAVITEDFRQWRYVRDNAEFGIGYVNLPSIGAEVHLPFGGVKKSGNGHPSAAGLLDSVTHRTAFTVNHSDEIQMAQGLSVTLK